MTSAQAVAARANPHSFLRLLMECSPLLGAAEASLTWFTWNR